MIVIHSHGTLQIGIRYSSPQVHFIRVCNFRDVDFVVLFHPQVRFDLSMLILLSVYYKTFAGSSYATYIFILIFEGNFLVKSAMVI